jgi:hypothetical protein
MLPGILMPLGFNLFGSILKGKNANRAALTQAFIRSQTLSYTNFQNHLRINWLNEKAFC